MVAVVALIAAICFVLASGQVFQDEQGLPAECVWTGDSCAAKSTGPYAALYHQVSQNFEACFSSTVVKGEYVQRYSGCGEVPPKATCESFFAVPLQICLPSTANWTSVEDLRSVLRLLIECTDEAVVSSRECDKFRADLYNGLQCPQCVAPANAVAAASAVCESITRESQCIPDAAAAAEFVDTSPTDTAVAPSPGLVLQTGEAFEDEAPLSVELPGGGYDGAFPAGVPAGVLMELDALDGSNANRALSDPEAPDSGQAPPPESSAAHSALQPLTSAVGVLLVVVSFL